MMEEFDPEAPSGLVIRDLRREDLPALIRIDESHTKRKRSEYLALKVRNSLEGTGVRISLVAELDGTPAGFILGAVYFGEYGRPEPVATIDTIGVHGEFGRRGIGRALYRQFSVNLLALGVRRVQTQLDWNEVPLRSFLTRSGFQPSQRICLEAEIGETG